MALGSRRVSLLALLAAAAAVDHSKFRTCAQTSFCRRHRDAKPTRAYVVAPGSVALSADGQVTATLHGGPFGVALHLELLAYASGVARLRLTEVSPLHGPRWEPDDILLEQTPVPLRPLAAGAAELPEALHAAVGDAGAEAWAVGPAADAPVLALQLHPFSATLYQDGVPSIELNPDSKLIFEHHRAKEAALGALKPADPETDVHAGKTVVDYGEDGLAVYSDGTKQEKGAAAEPEAAEAAEEGLWEENFGAHRDSKPRGPAAVGLDVRFPEVEHVYGLAEHAAPLNLPSTRGEGARYSEPYRLWTLDVYDYELDSPMALYGGVPLLWSHKTNRTNAILWFNPTETFVDVARTGGGGGLFGGGGDKSTSASWLSESGIIDVMLLPGPTPQRVFEQYAKLTGVTPLPPLFSLGYHQCRWNYNDEADVRYVHGQFEALDLPFDVLWLDIEHTDGKRYFTWDGYKFPNPKQMQEELNAKGRKMVTIVDPHIKKDSSYKVYQEAHEKQLFVKTKDGEEFDGWCWPGSSAYLDFTDAAVRDWWAARFNYDAYEGSTPSLYTWNDMNEPSVFNGPEVSMSKDCTSLAGIEHREWHNLYGMYMQRATAEGLLKRNEPQDKRPFVLSRSFYAGSQRWGAIWTGDNACKWDHLAASVPMLLSLGICGITFSGADVGGFLGKGGGYGDPDAELFTRWFEAGAYTPFFRGHAHHDSARREPWTFGDETTATLREVAKERYQLLAYWYTLFFQSETRGTPTMRPLWVEYPDEPALWGLDDQWLVGADLLVKPVASKGANSVSVLFPGTEPWYGVRDGAVQRGPGAKDIAAPLGSIPVFQRGGSIVPRQMRLRRSSAAMLNDPYTLVVAVDSTGAAEGQLFLDAGDGYGYREGAYALRRYSFVDGVLESVSLHDGASSGFAPPNTLERLELLGVSSPSRVELRAASSAAPQSIDFAYDAATRRLVVRKPGVRMAADWSIALL